MTQAPPPPGPQQPYSPPSYSQQPQQPQRPQKVKPSAIWYLIALLCVIGGGVYAFSQGIDWFDEFMAFIESFEHAEVPGEVSYTCPKAGTYAIYFVGPNATQTRRSQQSENPYTLKIVNAETGEPLAMETIKSQGIELNDEELRAWQGFKVQERTKVIVTVTASDNASPVAIAIGPEMSGEDVMAMMKDVFAIMAVVGGGALLGLIIFLVTIIRRSSCKSRIRRQRQGGWA